MAQSGTTIALLWGASPTREPNYPTLVEDRNGNRIVLEYQGTWGAGMPNSSPRIAWIADLRAPANTQKSYEFQYTTGQLPRLIKIKNNVNTGEEYSFTYALDQPLWTPMSPVQQRGVTSLLTEVKVDKTGARWLFEYGSNQAAELTRVTLPLGGELQYEYNQRDYPNGRRFREVSVRRLKTTPSASPWTYTFSVGSGDVGQNGVLRRILTDPSGPVRRWSFVTAGGSETPFGRLKIFEEAVNATAANPLLRQELTWTQDSVGRWYNSATLTSLDPGTANERVSKTEIVRDVYGFVTTQRVYDYGNLNTPKRTYTYTYTSIVNARLPVQAQVSEGGQTFTLASWQYDMFPLTDAPAMSYHNPVMDVSFFYRGLPTMTTTLGGPTEYRWYDIGGNVVKYSRDGGPIVNVTVNSASQWAAPSLVVPNSNTNLADSYQWNQYLLLTSSVGPNGASQSIAYDFLGRPTSVTSPHGAVTTYTYNDTALPATVTETTNGRWVRTTLDGLGRPIRVERGYSATTVSITDTEYAPCACSPIGRVKRVSQPYAPGGTVYWTEYEFDARGRTVKVTPPGNMGFTSYVYEGNTVKVVEPGGARWKRFTLDALGRLVKVTEPRPGAPGQSDDTSYSYNALDKLTTVTMPRGYVTQTRTFVYDSQMRLASVTQPENGTVSYTYDSAGRVASRTDARGARAEYVYDSYGRLSMIRRYPASGGEDTWQRTTFIYDSYGYGQNQWGRLAGIQYGYGLSEMFSYTQGGRVSEHLQDWSSVRMSVKYGWDNEGRMTWMEYPETIRQDPVTSEWVTQPGRRLNYTLDGMGRPVTVRDQSMNFGNWDWVSGAVYNAADQLVQFNRPWGAQRTYQYNVRGQLVRERDVVGGYPSMDFEYRYSATANDGRIVQMKDWVSGEEVNYQYDELGRLIAAATTGPEWGLSWTYDGFGNRLSQNVTKGSGPVVSLTVDPLTNRISTFGFSYYYWVINASPRKMGSMAAAGSASR
jgi:YD repeat-containing protein